MMNVGLAGPHDAGPVTALMRDCFDSSTLRMTIYGCDGIERFLETRMGLPLPLTDRRHIVARDAASVAVGFAELRLIKDAVCLNYIAVLLAWRGARAGDRLFAHALDLVREERHQKVILDVFSSNGKACSWYAKLGFEPERETVWWSLPLQFSDRAASAVAQCELAGWPEAIASESIYGFSRFELRTPRGRYHIGRLGRQWFKTDNPDLIDDESAVACLALLDPARKILGLFPSQLDLGEREGALRIDSSMRMAAGLERLRERLAERTRS